MPGNVGSSTPGAAPKHREEEPQVSPHGQNHQKPALWLSGLQHLNPAAKSASTHENILMIIEMQRQDGFWELQSTLLVDNKYST